jgi:hypothetical protein
MNDNIDVKEKNKKRLIFLRKLYEFVQADRFKPVYGHQIGDQLGFDENETQRIVQYLEGEGLINYIGNVGEFILTHKGVKKVESSSGIDSSEKHSTKQVIKVNKMINSQIQQGTENITQKQNSNNVNLNVNETRKKGYIAGIISIFICIIFAIMVYQLGWNTTGQILTAFSGLFGVLGIGSLVKPESIGSITSQILENIGKDDEQESKGKSKARKNN